MTEPSTGAQPSTVDEPELIAIDAPAEGTPPVIATTAALGAAVAALRDGTGPVAADAERASGYRYGQRTYLVQLRRAGVGTLLLDPVATGPLDGVAAAAGDAEWVLHAANQDLPGFHDLGMYPAALFDTELAARLLGRQRVGLGALLAGELGYQLAKEHSAADWSTRPLPEDWLRYAALDVEFLVDLRDILAQELDRSGKLEWAHQEFEAVRLAPAPPPKVDPWRRTSGLHSVRDPRGVGVVRQMWLARDELAQRRDRAPGRVLPDRAIVAAALALPRTKDALGALPEFSGRGTQRSLDHWWRAVDEALSLPQSDLPPRRVAHGAGTPPPPRVWPEKDPAAARRLDAVRTSVRELAESLDLPQENLLTPATQRQIAWTPPSGTVDEVAVREFLESHGARPWQVELTAGLLTEAVRAD